MTLDELLKIMSDFEIILLYEYDCNAFLYEGVKLRIPYRYKKLKVKSLILINELNKIKIGVTENED